MEGIVLEPGVFASALGTLNAATLIILAVEAILLGSLAEEEWSGARSWSAEWPIPGAAPEAAWVEIRKAA